MEEPDPPLTQVYWNIRQQCWSLRDAKTRKVYDHRGHVCLRRAKFHVSERGRDRVRRERKKNVHAYVSGEVVDSLGDTDYSDLQRVSYNPYVQDWFERSDRPGYEVFSSPWVELIPCGEVWALFEDEL